MRGDTTLPRLNPERLDLSRRPRVLGQRGAGVGAATGDTKTGAKTGLVLGGLAALGGSRGAQRAMVNALLDRPDWAGTLADYIARSAPRAGMMFAGLGSAFNPAFAPAQ